MAPQHVETMDTLLALKRKLQRDKEASSFAQPVSGATNRYNKLQKGAGSVHAGALPYPRGPEGYKQTIEHAGYSRSILAHNPLRLNGDGEELVHDESDTEADADAQDENPYAGVRIEDILAPLRHPSELATHPGLSQPYTDPALDVQVREIEETIRQEKAKLANCKTLQQKLMLDEPFIPLGRIETENDWDLYEPKPNHSALSRRYSQQAQNGINGHAQPTTASSPFEPVQPDTSMDDQNEVAGADPGSLSTDQPTTADDVDMQDSGAQTEKATETKSESAPKEDTALEDSGDMENANNRDKADPPGSDAGSPAPPSRRITRALAAENTTVDGASQRSASPSISSDLLRPDPVYLLPSRLSTDSRLRALLENTGMTYEELIETRRLLGLYIQKHEEVIRGLESIAQKLYKVKRMRNRVFEACKAEGQLGELSDGEDYIDSEAWGLKPEELKKGRDEDEVGEAAAEEEAQQTRGRAKGKRRRAREKE